MWCSSCQQDVPGVASGDDGAICCPRCHEALNSSTDASGVSSEPLAVLKDESTGWFSDSPPVDVDDWELDEDLRTAERVVHESGLSGYEPPDENLRLDAAPSSARRPRRQPARRAPRRYGGFVAWTMLSLGLMAFVFGGMLIGWSFYAERDDLWRLGMPFALAGQAVLVIGLVFHLDGLWRSNRTANETLDELDEQLDELRKTASLLSSTRSTPSQQFYFHMAEGASPHTLLADLKGQLDLLAIKLSKER